MPAVKAYGEIPRDDGRTWDEAYRDAEAARSCRVKHFCHRYHNILHPPCLEDGEKAEPCTICDLHDARRVARESGRVLPFYVLAVGTSRHYGGPEEGGWWYDQQEILEVRRVYTVEAGISALRDLRESHAQPRWNRFSCANNGEPDVHFMTCYAESDPRWPDENRERPHYE